MASGTVWLGLWLHASARTALMLGALPFLPGQAVKVVAAAGIFASFARWRKA
jgi:biotin transport system substrate-specific component